ncbi:hypothetical protein DPMN_146151 [Dreissena polymorpha]|uniref:C2H2-type domain-containing protein n=1 Tax=Dreissena polymorpha TaxID=45954 RepID=A0A9D4F5C6_DREPO|nr:hypothetical protein DPMN_146151 [Dreissena polymorpha]
MHEQSMHFHAKPFKCRDCSKTCKRKYQLNMHMWKNHGKETSFECDKYQKRFQIKYKFQIHQKACNSQSNRRVMCEICIKTFKNESSLRKHVTVIQRAETFKYDVCDTAFKRKDHFTRHL